MTKRTLICSTALVSALTGSAFADKGAGSMDQSAPSIIPDVAFSAKGKETVKLRFNGRLHADYNSLANDEGDLETTNRFYFRRLRLGVKATLGNDWTAETVYDFAGEEVSVDKAVIGYGDFKLGYQKVPFGFQETTSSAKIKTIERSAVNRYFADDIDFAGRHTGLHYKTKLGGGFKFAAALTNSFQGDSSKLNDGDSQDDDLAYWARLQWANDNLTVGVDYGVQTENGSGTGSKEDDGYSAYTTYVNYKVGGFDILGEYFAGEFDDADKDTDGFAVRVAYKMDKLEPVYRYSHIDSDDAIDAGELIRRAPEAVGSGAGELDSHYIGVNYYYSESVKFMLGYEWAEAENDAGDTFEDISGVRARVQILF